MNPQYSKQASRSLRQTDIGGVYKGMGYLDEFDVKKYVKDRLSEIKDKDEYALAKSVLYEGLYKMSEVFEERYKALHNKVYEELERKEESYEIAILLLSKNENKFLRMFFPISDLDVIEDKGSDIKRDSKEDKKSIKTIYLDATDSMCKAFLQENIRLSFTNNGEKHTILVQPKKALRYRKELGKLYETFSYNGLRWNTVNTVYLDRFFDIDLSEIPESAIDVEVVYGKYADMIKEELYPIWNIERNVFKSSTFLSPSKDGLYYEREMVKQGNKEIILRLVLKTEGMVGIRHEEEKIIVKSYEESYSDLEGYNIFDIRYTKEELPIGLISNKRKEGMIGRLLNKAKEKIHTEAEIERIIEELDIGEYVSLKSCERLATNKAFLEEMKILPDMNNFTNENFQLTDESPKLILRFLRNSDSNLCEAMVRYAISQLQISFDEYICIGVLENSYSL
ncbi:hypothetical protein HMPREF1866_01540 [Lachnoanaerobaculum saburreum]|uniref:Normocyte-binding protein n=3 Tax=Lachnoanaerobaculum TaxID=1164882 RepID=A0A133ZNY4_9FIRM|nr:hypothetical protein HMPREF1866_01540 [Lachnoanaerobaculum saburreum]